MEGIIAIVSAVIAFLVVVGFFIGFARGWCRALIRLSIVIVDFVLSLLISPLLTSSFINKYASGTTLSLFSYQIDFSEIAENMFESNLGEDLNLVTEEIEDVARSLLNVVANIVLFFVLFFLILFLSLIVYWVVLIIVKNVSKKEKTEEKSPLYTRFIGGFEGVLTTFVIGFVVLVPFFGAMNICNKFLVDNEKSSTENVTSAVSIKNIVAGQLYYTEDEQIGKFENYIEKYSYIKSTYDKSAVGKIFNFTRIGKAGSSFFDYLTKVKYKGENVKFSDEISVVIETYNIYKELFKEGSFDITNNDSLDSVSKISDKITKSKVATSLVENLLPTVLENWSNGEKFLGVEIKVNDEFKNLFADAINAVKDIKTVNRLNYNIKNIIESIKILNNHEIYISKVDNSVLNKIKADETVIQEVVYKLSQTEEIKNNIPILLDDVVEVLYKKLTGEEEYERLDKDSIIEIQDWEEESKTIQSIAKSILALYEGLEGEEAHISYLLNGVGGLLDSSKNSKILSNSVKNFVNAYVESENFANDVLDADTKNKLVTYISNKWESENTNFKFEKVFSVIAQITEFADNFADGENVQVTNLKPMFEEIINNDSIKQDVVEFVETNILDQIVKNDEFEIVALDLFKQVIYNSTIATLDYDLSAGQALVNLSTQVDEFNEEIATTNLETISRSTVFMNYIDNTSNLEGTSPLQKIVNSSLTPSERLVFVLVIENSTTLSQSEKAIFDKLFLSFSL